MTDIEGLLSSIGPEELERLKSVASSILADNSQNAPPDDSKSDFSLDALKPVMSAIGKMNANDDRISLIMHLKPLLGGERQKRADEAINFLRLMQILPEIRGIMNE